MAGTSNRFKRNAETAGVEPKVVKHETEEKETVNDTEVITPAPEQKEVPAAPVVPQVTEISAPVASENHNMTVTLDGMVDLKKRFKKREPKSKPVQLSITPTMFEQLQFLVDTNMIKSRNDFICQLTENALNNIFSNPEVRDAFNETQKWEK